MRHLNPHIQATLQRPRTTRETSQETPVWMASARQRRALDHADLIRAECHLEIDERTERD
jgi:hypothetical protein